MVEERFLACNWRGHLVAVDLTGVAEVRRPHGEVQLVFQGDRTATVERVFGVLDPEENDVLPLPPWLKRRDNLLRGFIRSESMYYLRVTPEFLIHGARLDMDEIRAHPHRDAAVATPSDKLLSFSIPCLGDPELPPVALSRRQVLEIRSFELPVSLPSEPGRLVGLIPWRGQMVAMLDLSLALGYSPTALSAAGRTLFLRCASRPEPVAIPVSAQVLHTVQLDNYRRWEPPPHANQAALRGSFVSPTGPLLVPDLDSLI